MTKFNRRDLIKNAAGAAALGSIATWPRLVEGSTHIGSNILWINLHAFGGWDQALFCDPKPTLRGPYIDLVPLFSDPKSIRTAGSIPYLSFADFGKPAAEGLFAKYSDRMLVINGIDTGTNGHGNGMMLLTAGSDEPNFPAFTAQVASVYGKHQALPFLFAGATHAATSGIVPSTAIGSPGLLYSMFNYNEAQYGRYMEDDTLSLVAAAHERRIKKIATSNPLPETIKAMDDLASARMAQKNLKKVVVPPSALGGYFFNGHNAQPLIDIGFSAFAAGQGTALSLGIAYFDHHSDNEAQHAGHLKDFFNHIAYVMDKAEAEKVPVVLVCSSDFGRTPDREGSGTGHWPISSLLILQSSAVKGKINLPYGQVIGGTNDRIEPLKVNPSTLKMDSNGVVLTPQQIYRGLRRIAGIEGAPSLAPFPIKAEKDINIG